jgi:TolB-like protein/Tfp pilus assembly protein PilF
VNFDSGTRLGPSPQGDSPPGRHRVYGMALDLGTKLGPYEIVAPLGAGGMGEVYRATDAKLKRDVAIKVLPESLAKDPAALARFEREALAVAALSHPNILSIFDFGRQGEIAYAVTELLEGGTLRSKLDAAPIPLKQAIDYALQIARGLSAAHDKGIVHRDLKPENLFVTKDGHLKILDFGLAKRIETEEDEARQTQAGMVMGTVGYMSPEQVRGQAVDRRSDVFSFGAILYELLSRKRAFKRASSVETMEAILRSEPAELSRSSGAPPALEAIVKRCLEKSPDRRFESAREVAIALEELWSPVATASSPRLRLPKRLLPVAVAGVVLLAAAAASYFVWRGGAAPRASRAKWTPRSGRPARLVVLPFENLGAPEDAYFAAGMTDEIIGRLANLRGLVVISRTTAIGYDRKGKTVRQIGEDLDVDFVLEGTVRSEHGPGREGRVRISPELIQVADDAHVWGDRYDRTTSDIFSIQSEVGENVARAAGLTLVPREKTALAAASTKDVEAYDLYLRGLAMANRSQTRQDQEGALRLFRAAADKDPAFPQALAMLARTHLFIYFLHLDRSAEHVDRAREAVDRLAAIGADLPETHVARAYLWYWGLLDLPRALEEFKAALALQPSNSEAVTGLGYVLRRQGRFEESAGQMSKLLELDPRNPVALYQYGNTCMLLRRYAEADRVWRASASLYPQSGNAWGRRAWLQVQWLGDVAKARSILAEARRVVGIVDDSDWLALASFRVALAERDYRGALALLANGERKAFSSNFFFLPAELLRAEVLGLSGQNDEARRSFDAAQRDLEERIRTSPDEPRYHGSLAIADAGLGLRDEALRAANRGVELMPSAKDAWMGAWRIEELALVHTMLGQEDEAIDRLDFLLAHTGEISTLALRLDPRWDSLRKSPRFAALLVRYEKE